MANIKARTKAQLALQLRMSGLHWNEIASQANYNSPQAACKAAHDLLKRVDVETTAQYRAVAMSRLDTLLQSIWIKVLSGDLYSVQTALKIEDRRSKLMNLDLSKPVGLLGENDSDVTIHIVRENSTPAGTVVPVPVAKPEKTRKKTRETSRKSKNK